VNEDQKKRAAFKHDPERSGRRSISRLVCFAKMPFGTNRGGKTLENSKHPTLPDGGYHRDEERT